MRNWIFILLSVFSLSAQGALVRENFWGIRQTGMGNTGVALADDGNLMWYNPAGLAKQKEFHNQLINFQMAVDSADTFSRIESAISSGDFSNLVRPGNQHMQASLRSTSIAPYFGIGFFDNLVAYYDIPDVFTPNAQVDVYSFNDLGLIAGFGLPVGKWVSLGFTGRVFQRTAVDAVYTSADILSLAGTNPANFQQNIFDSVQALSGVGFGIAFNFGALIEIPMKSRNTTGRVGLHVEDFASTAFSAIGDSTPPPNALQKVHLGSAIIYELSKNQRLSFALDYRNIFSAGNLWARTHLGIEYKNNWVGLRLGLHQGYPSAGISFTQPPHTRIQFSTYASEIGSVLWDTPRRMYNLEIIIGFNPH